MVCFTSALVLKTSDLRLRLYVDPAFKGTFYLQSITLTDILQKHVVVCQNLVFFFSFSVLDFFFTYWDTHFYLGWTGDTTDIGKCT